MRIPLFMPGIGCPHRCAFCRQETITGTRGFPTEEEMTAIIESHLSTRKEGPVEIAFFGGTFTALPLDVQKRSLDLAKAYVEREGLTGIRISTRPDDLDEEKIRLLLAYPLIAVELGAQSLNDAVLMRNERGHRVSAVEDAVHLLKEHGIPVVLQLMLGLDGSDARSDLSSVTKALALEPMAIRLYPTVVIEATTLAERYRRGAYNPLGLEEAVGRTADALDLAEKAGVPCLRVGLPMEGLIDNASVLAGPVHLNFGQLVADERRIRRLSALISPGQQRLKITVPDRERGDYIGYKSQIIRYFKNRQVELVIHGDPRMTCGQLETGKEVSRRVLEKN